MSSVGWRSQLARLFIEAVQTKRFPNHHAHAQLLCSSVIPCGQKGFKFLGPPVLGNEVYHERYILVP